MLKKSDKISLIDKFSSATRSCRNEVILEHSEDERQNDDSVTMQDDLAGLISKKNYIKPKKKKIIKVGTKKMSKEEREVQRNLAEVYTDGDGEIPDLTRLEKSQRPAWKTALYTASTVLFLLLVMAIAGFFVFYSFGQDSFTNELITLKIDPPITLVSGQEMTYTILVTNREKVDLYNARLKLEYPDNFQFISSEPAPNGERDNVWNFSILRTGETQKIKIVAKLIAAVNSAQTFKGSLSFKPANLNAEFKQEAIVDVAVSSSVIDLEINGTDKTLANQSVEYNIKYENIGEEDLDDLQLVVEYPTGFVLESIEPAPEENLSVAGKSDAWIIDALQINEDGEIKIIGNYSNVESGGNQEFKARIQLRQNGDYYPQDNEVFITSVIKDQLSLKLIINGSAEDQPINFEELLIYSLAYKNTGQEELRDVEIVAHLDSQILDWGSLNDGSGGRWQENSIVWTGKEVPQLLKLGAGEEGIISWTIKVEDANVINNENVSKFSVNNYVEGKAKQTGEFSGESTVKSKIIVNSINSDLNLIAAARYYNEDNIPLGAGPIQPTVGEKSVYNIKVELANNLHDIKDIMAVATLPKNVSWANKEGHTTGDVIYNQESNKVTWSISRLSKSAENTYVIFNVEIEPKNDDFGRVLILVSEIAMRAKDADTGADINQNMKAITTAFKDPILGQVSGIVQ